MSMGMFRPTFASFTDKHTFYEDKEDSARNTSERIYFQTPSSLGIDKIVYEFDDRGRLVFESVSDDPASFTILGDVLFATGSVTNADKSKLMPQTGSAFASTVETVKGRVLEAFTDNKFIRTVGGIDLKQKTFKTNIDDHTFAISNSVPFSFGPDNAIGNMDNIESFMFDSKLTHIKNFKFLPPVNENHTEENQNFFGIYEDFRSTTKESLSDIYSQLNINTFPNEDFVATEGETVYDTVDDYKVLNRAPGLLPGQVNITKEYVQINFTETSDLNNLLTQFYEEDKNKGTITKLEIIDAGEFPFDENDVERPAKRVFYVGKIFFDQNNIPSFINYFTVFFD